MHLYASKSFADTTIYKLQPTLLFTTCPMFMIKDYVKSEKGTDFPSFFDDTIEQSEFDFYMNKFYEYRANLFTGGICVKEYVSLKEYAGKKNEVRAFYANGKLLCTTRNESPCALMKNPPESLICKYEHLQNPVYTIDFAETDEVHGKLSKQGMGKFQGFWKRLTIKSFFGYWLWLNEFCYVAVNNSR